jgi:putative SOS response-associated peptidase YedK
MCNLYRQRTGPLAVMDMAKAMTSSVGNLAPGDVYPDYAAPIVRTDANGVRELALARWGMPSSSRAVYEAATKRADKLRAKGTEFDFQELLKRE